MNNDDREIELFKAELQAAHQRELHSDRAAVDIGLTTLRTAILVNAGALVALLAFAGQLWGKNFGKMSFVLQDARWFVFGLVSAGVGAIVAYFYQSFVTRTQQSLLERFYVDDGHPKRHFVTHRLTGITAIVMVMLVVLSYVAFIIGAISLSNDLSP